jgi:hypothetical protein
MRENDKARCFTQAIDLLVEQAVATKRPDTPGAYAATVRADLSERMRPKARDVFAERDEVTASELAAILSESDRRPTLPGPPVVSAAAALSAYAADEWTPPPEVRAQARERIASIRATLHAKHTGGPK